MKAEQKIRQALIELGFEFVEGNLYRKFTEIFEISVCFEKGLIVKVMLYSGKSVYTKEQAFTELEVDYMKTPFKSFIEDVIMKSLSEISMAYIFEREYKVSGVVAKTVSWL